MSQVIEGNLRTDQVIAILACMDEVVLAKHLQLQHDTYIMLAKRLRRKDPDLYALATSGPQRAFRSIEDYAADNDIGI
jgi:hypothetical protein